MQVGAGNSKEYRLTDLASKLASRQDYMYIPIATTANYTKDDGLYGDDNLDVTTYNSGVYLVTDDDLKNNVFTTSGVRIE